MNIFAETSDVTKKLLDGVMEQVTITDEEAFVNDKVTKVIRTRVTAEICSTLVKLHSLKILENKMLIQKMSRWLIDNQNSNGSWNEAHINYNQPSTVFTSVCALSLLEVSESFPEFNINEEIFDIFFKDISVLNKLGFIPIILHGGGKRISNKIRIIRC